MKLIGKKYMLLFCWLLTAPKAKITEVDLNHERIHSRQWVELTLFFLLMLGVLSVLSGKCLFLLAPFIFYAWYGVEWLIRLIQFWRIGYTSYKESNDKWLKRIKEALWKLNYMAYRNISFEREAYQNEGHLNYLENRKRFNFLKYLK